MNVKSKEYRTSWVEHKALIQKSIDIAKKMKDANIDNYLDLLAITPIQQWGKFRNIYLSEAQQSNAQKMTGHIQIVLE